MLAPTSGSIHVGTENITGWNPHRIARHGVGIKTQTPSVMDGLSIFENIWLAARRNHSTRQAKEITGETMARLGLEGKSGSNVGQLAHGERQRVELAMVITCDPWLVLLDEPAAGMTGSEIGVMISLIRDINTRAAIIIVEHDMQFIRSIAETVTVFHQGKILIEDNVDIVLNDTRVRDVYLGRENRSGSQKP
jgi:branched-chain amino acid transport system ATP-binding protein/urea transport system ATP-binding protein